MARRLSAVLTVVLLGLSSSVVHADSFGVTLRYWNAEESAPGSTTITPILSVTTEDTRSDVPGLTLRWSPDFWENHDFLFSYYEKDRDRVIRASRNPLDGSPSEVGTDFRGSVRSDFELLVRTRANDNVFYYYGLRYIERDFSSDGTGFVFIPTTSEQRWMLAEVGLGLISTISENGKHSVFANAVGGIGRSEGESTIEFQPGQFSRVDSLTRDLHSIDLNLGYQYTMSPRAALSLRYRNLSLYLDNELSLISSGADVGITFNF